MGDTGEPGEPVSLARRELAELADLEALAGAAAELAELGVAPATRRAYASSWRAWEAFAEAHGSAVLPASPAAVALYVAALVATPYTVATIQARLAAVATAHRAAGHASPTEDPRVRAVLRGARRRLGTAPASRTPLEREELERLISVLPGGPSGTRDRALLLVGWAGALRRAELVALEVRDVVRSSEGLAVTLRRSKTDQDGAGRLVGIPRARRPELCPARALAAWLELAEIQAGPIFRTVDRHGRIGAAQLGDRAVALVVKRAALAAGLDPANLAGHSLRSGFATSAARAGVADRAIQRQLGHKSPRTTAGYVRFGSLFLDNAASGLL